MKETKLEIQKNQQWIDKIEKCIAKGESFVMDEAKELNGKQA